MCFVVHASWHMRARASFIAFLELSWIELCRIGFSFARQILWGMKMWTCIYSWFCSWGTWCVRTTTATVCVCAGVRHTQCIAWIGMQRLSKSNIVELSWNVTCATIRIVTWSWYFVKQFRWMPIITVHTTWERRIWIQTIKWIVTWVWGPTHTLVSYFYHLQWTNIDDYIDYGCECDAWDERNAALRRNTCALAAFWYYSTYVSWR